MKLGFLTLCAACCLSFTGCGPAENSIVVDKDEMAQYEIPAGEMEKAMADAAKNAAKK